MMRRALRRLIQVTAFSSLLLVVYLLSYAPFLCIATPYDVSHQRAIYYRSPAAYRFADWCLVKTPLQPILLKWSRCFGVEGTTEWQAWYFARGIEDPSSEVHFNI